MGGDLCEFQASLVPTVNFKPTRLHSDDALSQKAYLCVCSDVTACVGRSEGNRVETILSFYLPGMELEFSGLHSKYLYWIRHHRSLKKTILYICKLRFQRKRHFSFYKDKVNPKKLSKIHLTEIETFGATNV